MKVYVEKPKNPYISPGYWPPSLDKYDKLVVEATNQPLDNYPYYIEDKEKNVRWGLTAKWCRPLISIPEDLKEGEWYKVVSNWGKEVGYCPIGSIVQAFYLCDTWYFSHASYGIDAQAFTATFSYIKQLVKATPEEIEESLPKKEKTMEIKKTKSFQFCIDLASATGTGTVRARLARYLEDQGFDLVVDPRDARVQCLRIDVSNKIVNGAHSAAEFYRGRYLILSLEDWKVLPELGFDIAGHTVEQADITPNTAKVGCTTVTREDLMKLLGEMDKRAKSKNK